MWLPKGEKSLRICIIVSTQYRRVTDAQTDGQKSCDFRTLNALNSSLPNRPLHLLVAYVQ